MTPTLTHRSSMAGAMLVLALGAGACGGSDEQDIRAAARGWVTLGNKDAKRQCEQMTPRAQAQITGLMGSFSGGGSCVEVLSKTESGDDRPTAKDVDKAKLAIRGEFAVLSLPGEGDQNMGLRKVDGEWKIDNMINPSLTERPRRVDPQLSKGSDEQQLRATYQAVSTALAAGDYERGCALFSYGAEAQLLVGRLFASFGDTEQQHAPDLTCAASFRAIAKLADGQDDDLAFPDSPPSAAKLAAAEVTVHGSRATVRVQGKDPEDFVREEGHWRVAPDAEGITTEDAPSPASLERCWRRAGARIASSAGDVRFAVGGHARHITISPGRVSVKGPDWRIFYTLPSDGEDPGLAKVLAKPSTVRAVAYVSDAPAHAGIVARARVCGD